MFAETFFTRFREFYFLTQTEYFAWAIAFAKWPFLAILKMLSNISCFLERFFAENKLNVFAETFFTRFREFFILHGL